MLLYKCKGTTNPFTEPQNIETMYLTIAILTIIALVCTVWFANEENKTKTLIAVLLSAFILVGFGGSYDLGHYVGKFEGDKQVAVMIEKQEDLINQAKSQVVENLAVDLPAVAGEVYTVVGKGNNGTATADLIIVNTAKQKDGQQLKLFKKPSAFRHDLISVGTSLYYDGSSWVSRSF